MARFRAAVIRVFKGKEDRVRIILRRFLRAPLYCNVLAVNAAKADETLGVLSRSGLPLLVRKGDEEALTDDAKDCFALNERADKIYRALCRRPLNFYAARLVRR